MSAYRSLTNTLSLACQGSITVKDLEAIVNFAENNGISSESRVSFIETKSDNYNGSTTYTISISKVVAA